MKLFSLTVIAILVIAIASGQTLNANELITVTNCTDFDCLNDFMISKNFSLDERTEKDYGVFCSFLSDKTFKADNNTNVTKPNVAIFILYKSLSQRDASITSTSKSYYQTIKNSFISKGFTKTKTYNDTDPFAVSHVVTEFTSTSYKNLILKLEVVSRKKDGDQWTEYRISINRKL